MCVDLQTISDRLPNICLLVPVPPLYWYSYKSPEIPFVLQFWPDAELPSRFLSLYNCVMLKWHNLFDYLPLLSDWQRISACFLWLGVLGACSYLRGYKLLWWFYVVPGVAWECEQLSHIFASFEGLPHDPEAGRLPLISSLSGLSYV